uniref:DUF4136 domain-containing protein n=1 Tax=Ningiella ruwaisensis TaxID=2364274 RepID=UPI0014461A2B|nr:DUF4136 domain-containing protein [Ningiella ruwaisensis]
MQTVRLLICAVAAIILTACASGPRVYTDYDPEQDFTQYRTFTWTSDEPLKMQSDAIISPLVQNRIIDAVKATMETKGYTFVESLDQADIALSFTVGSREKMRVMQEPTFMVTNGWRWGGQYWGLNMPLYQESTRIYNEGSLAIDVFDNARKQPVWHGVSSKNLSSEEKAGKEEFVNLAVASTLADFPNQGQALKSAVQ